MQSPASGLGDGDGPVVTVRATGTATAVGTRAIGVPTSGTAPALLARCASLRALAYVTSAGVEVASIADDGETLARDARVVVPLGADGPSVDPAAVVALDWTTVAGARRPDAATLVALTTHRAACAVVRRDASGRLNVEGVRAIPPDPTRSGDARSAARADRQIRACPTHPAVAILNPEGARVVAVPSGDVLARVDAPKSAGALVACAWADHRAWGGDPNADGAALALASRTEIAHVVWNFSNRTSQNGDGDGERGSGNLGSGRRSPPASWGEPQSVRRALLDAAGPVRAVISVGRWTFAASDVPVAIPTSTTAINVAFPPRDEPADDDSRANGNGTGNAGDAEEERRCSLATASVADGDGVVHLRARAAPETIPSSLLILPESRAAAAAAAAANVSASNVEDDAEANSALSVARATLHALTLTGDGSHSGRRFVSARRAPLPNAFGVPDILHADAPSSRPESARVVVGSTLAPPAFVVFTVDGDENDENDENDGTPRCVGRGDVWGIDRRARIASAAPGGGALDGWALVAADGDGDAKRSGGDGGGVRAGRFVGSFASRGDAPAALAVTRYVVDVAAESAATKETAKETAIQSSSRRGDGDGDVGAGGISRTSISPAAAAALARVGVEIGGVGPRGDDGRGAHAETVDSPNAIPTAIASDFTRDVPRKTSGSSLARASVSASPRPRPRPFCGYPGEPSSSPSRSTTTRTVESTPTPAPSAPKTAPFTPSTPSRASASGPGVDVDVVLSAIRALGDHVDRRMDRVEAAMQAHDRRLRAVEAALKRPDAR